MTKVARKEQERSVPRADFRRTFWGLEWEGKELSSANSGAKDSSRRA